MLRQVFVGEDALLARQGAITDPAVRGVCNLRFRKSHYAIFGAQNGNIRQSGNDCRG